MRSTPVEQRKPRAVRSKSALSPASKREASIRAQAGSEDAVDKAPSRPNGSLSSAEIERLRAAYRAGATGHLVIGLRQQARLLTVMIPVQHTEASMAHHMQGYAMRLRALRCNGYIHVRRVRLRRSSQEAIAAMLIEQSMLREHRQQFVEIDTGKPAGWLRNNLIADTVTRALQRAFDDE